MPTLRQLLVGERYYAARRQCERSLDWYLVLHCAYLASVLLIALRADDPDFARVHDMATLEAVKPGITAKLVDWLKMYKTTDGKGINQLAQLMNCMRKPQQAEALFREAVNGRTEVLGSRHPQTLNAMGHLALCLCEQGQPSAAVAYGSDVVEPPRPRDEL